jgi:RNA polymerase-binding transcription factor DksA
LAEFDRQQVEKRLRERAEEIAERRSNLELSSAGMDTELADYDQHPGDTGTETHEQELDETTDMILAAEAENVELALARLREGTYGICIECGKEIPAARLDAIPESVRCIEDQARYEATLKARGLPPNRGF